MIQFIKPALPTLGMLAVAGVLLFLAGCAASSGSEEAPAAMQSLSAPATPEATSEAVTPPLAAAPSGTETATFALG
jgi:hypothetical protein